MKKLVLIDGNSLLNRAFYATPVFMTKNGMPTNAIFGFTKLLFKIQADLKPEYLIVTFDLKEPTFRHKMFEGYKATRKSMPEDLAVQVEPLKNLLRAMRVAICEKAGFEADDLLGTLSKKFDVHSYIYTGDRDSFQLVGARTDVYYTRRGVSDLLKLNADNFKEETGLESPSQIVDLKALMGDKSDNIPGVPGIGEKTAYTLLQQYGNLDGIYANIDEIKGSTGVKLQCNKELAYLSYKLATIDTQCKLDISLENCVSPTKFNGEVKKIFTEFEFRSLLGMDIFDEKTSSSAADKIVYPEKINCGSFEKIESVLQEQNVFYIHLNDKSVEIFTGGKQYSLAFSESIIPDSGISYDALKLVYKNIFENPANKVISDDCKKIMHALKKCDVDFACDYEDILLMNYLCDYETASLSLKDLCAFYNLDYAFSAYDISWLYSAISVRLKDSNTLNLYESIEKPLIKVLFEMECEGVKISLKVLDELSAHFHNLSEEYKNKVFEICGKQFNLNSPMQLGEVLYGKLGIVEVKKKNGKFVTRADVLEKIADKYPVVENILKYRFYQKINSTYLDGLRPVIDKRSGQVHTTYTQTVTTTGRLSSVNPNLQNIPIRDEEGRELRKLFVAREGNVFLDADYSQIELRLLAHFSGCKELIEAYGSGIDIHSVTASQVFGVGIDEVTSKMRRAAKAVNFGIIYGISEYGLSKNLNISTATAREYISKYFETYSAVKDFMNKNVEFAREHGYVSTITGRKRVIPEIKSTNYAIRQFGERAAMNMPLQGSSADIIKIAMINVDKTLKAAGLKTKIILQVHDELILEAPESEAELASEILKYEMENAVKLKVPLEVEVHGGKNWYDAK